MSPVIASLWVAGLALEFFGAIGAFRRKLWSLFSLLAFSAAASVIIAFIRAYAGKTAYSWAFWIQYAGQYLLLASLAVFIAAQFIREKDKRVIFSTCAMICILLIMASALALIHAPTLRVKLLSAEVFCDCILFIGVGMGWVTRYESLKRPWNWIVAGFIVRIGTDIVCTALWLNGVRLAQHLYWAGELSALILWCAGPLRGLGEFRRELGKRLELPKETYTRVM